MFFDPDGRKSRTYAKSMSYTHGAHTEFIRLLGRLLLLPVWLPMLFWKKRKWKREQIDFVLESLRKGAANPEWMALEWVTSHPKQYRYGEYDPALPEVQTTFERLLDSPGVLKG